MGNLELRIQNPWRGLQYPSPSWIPLHVLHGGEKFSKIQALLVNSCDFVLRDKTGKFPDYPDDDEGGSAAIFKEKDPAEVTFKSFSQWWILGRGPGGPRPPLLLDQTEAQRAGKQFFWDRAPPPGGLDPPLSLVALFMFTFDLCCWTSL